MRINTSSKSIRSTRNVCTQPQKPPHAFGAHDGDRSRSSSHGSPEYLDDARRRVDDVVRESSDDTSDATDDPAAVTMLNDAIDGGEVAIVFASSDIGPLDGSNATTGKARGADGTRKARRGGAGERSGVVRKRCGSEAAFHAAPRFTRKRTGAMYRRNVRAQCDVGTRGHYSVWKNSKKWF